MVKVFVILDGVADREMIKLGNKTPLEYAKKKNLDWFAKNGCNGYCYTISKTIAPESDEAIWALLGRDPKLSYAGRGPLECYGRGVHINKGDLCLRVNFSTVYGDKILDRRVGRSLTTKEAKELGREINKKVKLKAPFMFIPTIGHRGILIIRGDFSANISNVDPAYIKNGNLTHAVEHPSFIIKQCKALDRSKKSKLAADIVNEFVKQSKYVLGTSKINYLRVKRGLPRANALIPRDPGIELPNIKKNFISWCAVVAMPLEIGIARLNGMHIHSFNYPESKNKDPYPQLYKSLNVSIKEAKRAISERKFNHYWIHLKETDIPGHDGRYLDKIKMIELIDKKFFSFLRKIKNIELVVTADHATPCSMRAHSTDAVPILWYGRKKDSVEKFGESYCKGGALGEMKGKELLKKVGFI